MRTAITGPLVYDHEEQLVDGILEGPENEVMRLMSLFGSKWQARGRALQSQGCVLRVGPPAFGKDLPIWKGPLHRGGRA